MQPPLRRLNSKRPDPAVYSVDALCFIFGVFCFVTIRALAPCITAISDGKFEKHHDKSFDLSQSRGLVLDFFSYRCQHCFGHLN